MNQDITFCMEDCDNLDCIRNRKQAVISTPHSFAYLRNTEYCPRYQEEQNIINQECEFCNL